MNPRSAAFVVVMLAWAVLGALLVRARIRARRGAGAGDAGATRRRDLASWGGIAVQGLGFAIAFNARRADGAPLVPGAPPWIDATLMGLAALLAIGAALFAGWALHTLDKQWSLTARVRADHALVTRGAFAWVRHPIYAALLGLLVATGIALDDGRALLLAIAVYVAGTLWRAGREERLLREAFGAEYDAYAARVPQLVPLGRRPRRV